MKLKAIVKHILPCLPAHLEEAWSYCAPSVTGPKGGHIKVYAQAYAACEVPANYPVPAPRMPTFESLRDYGYISAQNGFPLEIAFRFIRK